MMDVQSRQWEIDRIRAFNNLNWVSLSTGGREYERQRHACDIANERPCI